MKQVIQEILSAIQDETPENSLRIIALLYPRGTVFSTSLGLEDQVITHLIFAKSIPIDIFTLDTGRLFSETEKTLSKTIAHYKEDIKRFYPIPESVDKLVSEKGNFSFFESVDNRKECCFIRKVEPLKRALNGRKVWITGIRAEQSGSRKDMPAVEWDEVNQIIKFHPLINWTFEETKSFIKQHQIPYNLLHDEGYVSIGCSPCTRAINPGEDFRAGRWWWEQEDKKECGLHNIKTTEK